MSMDSSFLSLSSLTRPIHSMVRPVSIRDAILSSHSRCHGISPFISVTSPLILKFFYSDHTSHHNSVSTPKIGFILRKSFSESAAQEDVERLLEYKHCLIDKLHRNDIYLNMSDPSMWNSFAESHKFNAKEAGLYSFLFVRCAPTGHHLVSFVLNAEFSNTGPNYLSAGDLPLPKLYLFLFVLFFVALVVWSRVLWTANGSDAVVHDVHRMMLALLILKTGTLFFESVRYHYIAIVGFSELWDLIYFIFAFLKGVMLFTVILLIGSGYSLMKSYLNDREKRLILIVLTLQVVDNIAMIVLEETAPGSKSWLRWRDVLHLVDIICCVAILFPIVWSINHLQQAAEADGKASGNLQKLKLFREFYTLVVVYIYFTRIVVYLLSASIEYHLLWLGDFVSEIATFLFYVITGYKFRPAPDNPYLVVSSDDARDVHSRPDSRQKDDGTNVYIEMSSTD